MSMFVDSEAANHAVRTLCRVAGVSRSGYYAWKSRPVSSRRAEDERLKAVVLETFTGNRSVYGARRIRAALQKKGIPISGRRCSRLMRSLVARS